MANSNTDLRNYAAGQRFRDTQVDATFTLTERDATDTGWWGERTDYGRWHVGDYALGKFYVALDEEEQR